MKRSTAQLGLSVPVLVNIIHAFPTVSHRARDLLKDSLAMRERVTHLMLNRCRGKHRKGGGNESWQTVRGEGLALCFSHYSGFNSIDNHGSAVFCVPSRSIKPRTHFGHKLMLCLPLDPPTDLLFKLPLCSTIRLRFKQFGQYFIQRKHLLKMTKDTVITLSVWQMRDSLMSWKMIKVLLLKKNTAFPSLEMRLSCHSILIVFETSREEPNVISVRRYLIERRA